MDNRTGDEANYCHKVWLLVTERLKRESDEAWWAMIVIVPGAIVFVCMMCYVNRRKTEEQTDKTI